MQNVKCKSEGESEDESQNLKSQITNKKRDTNHAFV